MSVTREVAGWVARLAIDGVPLGVTAAARAAVLDTIAVTLAGAGEPVTRIVAEAVAEDGARPVAAQLGTDLRTSAEGAALVNGVSGHALDYDDVSVSVRGHPSVVVLPAALAAAQSVSASGRALLEAYVAGVEVMTKLGRVMGPAHYRAGWHATSTLGTLGSAAAAGKLLGLDAGRITHALAIAASEASGSRQNFGTMTKPFHAGHAARCGLHAARLAQKGMTGDPAAIEGPVGFFAMFSFGDARPEELVRSLGAPFDLVSPGLSVKKYPCCFATHRAADGVLDLAGEHGIRPNDVAAVTVTVPAGGRQPLIHDRPETGLQGKFSMQYVIAAALLDRGLGFDAFSDAAVRRPEAQALLERVMVHEEPAFRDAANPMEEGHVTVEVRTTDGRRLARRIDHPRGSPALPLRREELLAKFRDCAARALDPAAVDRALTALDCIESVRDVNALVASLVPGPRPAAPVR
ncbi:MAG: MmgE/PrpD family protein [Bacillati bacterium ANGP1]|uniref:MmgE/PrpD family protein n=1 Tax=Candidatus Segetimicrobium genomatis TaxID=2569760 RepID=A0A537JKT8_9BACT|nr:MAG: MmgE/PrpD family protein [Terrabacteria group bacterium ANGP1]